MKNADTHPDNADQRVEQALAAVGKEQGGTNREGPHVPPVNDRKDLEDLESPPENVP